MRLIDADKALEWIDKEYPNVDRQDMKSNSADVAIEIVKAGGIEC